MEKLVSKQSDSGKMKKHSSGSKLNRKKKSKKISGTNVTQKETSNSIHKSKLNFHEMGIDDRILEGIASLRWPAPTLVQEKAIPFMLEGKSVMAQARTGSGKTGAFLVPCLHRVLFAKSTAQEQCVRLLVLAPSKELCRQTSEMASRLAIGCSRELKILDLSPQVPLSHQRPLLAELPDVVVGPPGRVLSHVLEGHLSLASVQSVVVDEADLMVAYQHGASLEQLWSHLPEYYQCFVTSATLAKDMKRINSLLLRNENQLANTVILRLKDPPLPTDGQLTQYVIKIEEFEKGVLLYALYRLNMIAGKTIIFVNSVNKGYKLRMFLGQFGIASCILNCELPGNSRCDIIEQFNAGRYDTIIATDETSLDSDANKLKLKDVEVDTESGTSRGLDFQFVCNVINFDFPKTVTSYIHRVGRTARGNNLGTALSMVSVKEHDTYLQVSNQLTKLMNPGKQAKTKTDDEGTFKTYVFDLSELDGFSYRARDVWSMCTHYSVLQTRKKEISQQLLNSKKLAAFFQDNPGDKALLKYDKKQHGIKTMNHLKNIPDYIVPEKLRTGGSSMITQQNASKKNVKRLQTTTAVPGNKLKTKSKNTDKKKKTKPMLKKGFCTEVKHLTKTQHRQAVKTADPLKSLTFSGF